MLLGYTRGWGLENDEKGKTANIPKRHIPNIPTNFKLDRITPCGTQGRQQIQSPGIEKSTAATVS